MLILCVNGSASSLPFGECVLSVFRRVVESRAAVRGEAEVASEEECERETQTFTSQSLWKCDSGVILPPSSRKDEALLHLLLD